MKSRLANFLMGFLLGLGGLALFRYLYYHQDSEMWPVIVILVMLFLGTLLSAVVVDEYNNKL